jgi:hypothetical protein
MGLDAGRRRVQRLQLQSGLLELFTRRPGFDPGSGQVGFVVDKVALCQVFSEYFGFPCQPSFHQLLHNHPSPIIWGWYNKPEVAAVQGT